MTDKVCCLIWTSSVDEIKFSKQNELDAAQSKGTPGYVLAPARDVFRSIHLFCPKCGTKLGSDVKEPTSPVPVQPKPVATKKTPCTDCRGTGQVGRELGGEVNCLRCLGRGYLDGHSKVIDRVQLTEEHHRKLEVIAKQKSKPTTQEDNGNS